MAEQDLKKKPSTKTAFFLGIFGIVATLLMAGAVVYYWEWVHDLGAYGYVGAFLISILGGATIIVPVPMLAVIFALGRVMEYSWLVGLANGLGETIGAITIYMTGYGGGSALIAVPTEVMRIYLLAPTPSFIQPPLPPGRCASVSRDISSSPVLAR